MILLSDPADVSDHIRAYCSAIGAQVAAMRSEAASMFEALAVLLGEEAETVRNRVVDTLPNDWSSLRVLDTEDRGQDFYGEQFLSFTSFKAQEYISYYEYTRISNMSYFRIYHKKITHFV